MDSQTAEIRHEIKGDVLRVSVCGPVTLQQLTTYVTRWQNEWVSQRRVLWNLTNTVASNITSQDILNVDQSFAEILARRSGGRTAILVGKDLELIARISIVLLQNRSVPVELEVFLSEDDALAWLNEI